MMKLPTLIKLIDLLSFIVLITMISTGTLLKFTLPPRSGGDSIWGLTRHQWGEIHYCLAVAFLLLMTVHLLVHFRYIKSAVLGRVTREQGYRIVIGIVSLVLLIALAFAPMMSSVDDGRDPGSGKRLQQHQQR